MVSIRSGPLVDKQNPYSVYSWNHLTVIDTCIYAYGSALNKCYLNKVLLLVTFQHGIVSILLKYCLCWLFHL